MRKGISGFLYSTIYDPAKFSHHTAAAGPRGCGRRGRGRGRGGAGGGGAGTAAGSRCRDGPPTSAAGGGHGDTYNHVNTFIVYTYMMYM